MRLISWNCQGAFRKKLGTIIPLSPDILVVQECESPEKLIFNPTLPKSTDFHWHSDGSKKGLALLSYSGYKFQLLPEYNPEFKYIIPFQVIHEKGQKKSFTLFTIWAMNNKENYYGRYIGQVWYAIKYYESILKQPVILIGDFNSNKIWDTKDRIANYTDVVQILEEKKIHSVYHKYNKLNQGEETHPTFYLFRKKERPYHIDYCFTSADLFRRIKHFEIGIYEHWIAYSDHMPLIIDF